MMAAKTPDVTDIFKRLDGGDDLDTAAATLDTLGVTGTARAALLPLVKSAVGQWRRAGTRSVEREAPPVADLTERWVSRPGRLAGTAEAPSSPLLRARLLRETFPLGDGTRPTWGDATVAQHTQRIDLLQRIVAGTNETINRHRDAIETIVAAGASCLNEVACAEVGAA